MVRNVNIEHLMYLEVYRRWYVRTNQLVTVYKVGIASCKLQADSVLSIAIHVPPHRFERNTTAQTVFTEQMRKLLRNRTLSKEVCPAPLPVHRVRVFARRARTYRMLFDRFPNREAADAFVRSWKEGKAIAIRAGEEDIILDSADKDDGFADMVEKMYKTVKTHCNIIDVDWHVCAQE